MKIDEKKMYVYKKNVTTITITTIFKYDMDKENVHVPNEIKKKNIIEWIKLKKKKHTYRCIKLDAFNFI